MFVRRREVQVVHLLCLAFAVICVSPACASVVPRYSSPDCAMVVDWSSVVGDIDGYKIERKANGDAVFQEIATTDDTQTIYVDTSVVYGTLYTYRVRPYKGEQNFAYSGEVPNCVDVTWPCPTTHEILHAYQDGLDWGAPLDKGNGFHKGIDIQGAGDQGLTAPRGGKVVTAKDYLSDEGNNVVIQVDVGNGNFEYDCFNHLKKNSLTDIGLDVGDSVQPGSGIGKILTNVWADPWKHTHFTVSSSSWGASIRSPLTIFDENGDKDPGGRTPAVVDDRDDGNESVMFRTHGSSAGSYYDYDEQVNPLAGDIDIIAEVHDQMGTEPMQGPLKLGYWIEGPSATANVKSNGNRYLLGDFGTYFFGTNTTNFALVFDNCADRNQGVHIPDSYPWPNYHNYILTNCKGENGAPADLDSSQCWNTNAKNDGADVTSDHANYAGLPDATKPTEARFPDGLYKIHVLMWDAIHSSVDYTKEVRVDNDPPTVKYVEVSADADGNASYEHLVYHFDYQPQADYPGGAGWLDSAQKTGGEYMRLPSGKGGRNIKIEIVFSESMDTTWGDFSVTYDPQGASGAAARTFNNGQWSTKTCSNDKWVGYATIPQPTQSSSASYDSRTGADHSLDAVIVITNAKDLTGKGPDSDCDGDWIEHNYMDQNHKFKIETRQKKKPSK